MRYLFIPTCFALFCLGGCDSLPPVLMTWQQRQELQQAQQQSKMSADLNQYIGGSIADFVIAKGPPASTTDISPTKRLFRWVFTGQSIGGVVPVGSAIVAIPSRQLQCTVSFVANTSKSKPSLQDWTVESYSWDGSC
jgi:hypothetical protein